MDLSSSPAPAPASDGPIERPSSWARPGLRRRNRVSSRPGFVGGFVKYDGRWFGAWVPAPPAVKRAQRLAACHDQLVRELELRGGGPTLTRRHMVVVDAICPDGREFLESLFQLIREQQPPDQA